MDIEKVELLLEISQEPLSLEEPYGEDQNVIFGNFIEDRSIEGPDKSASKSSLSREVTTILDTLDDREKNIIKQRYGLQNGQPKTLEEVGRNFKLTRERIRQIENKALEKLRHPSRSLNLKDYFSDL